MVDVVLISGVTPFPVVIFGVNAPESRIFPVPVESVPTAA
jgi:hypothetical protein